MLDAVYIDLIASRSIVGWLPKPAFYSLFESLRQKPDSKVIVFNPGESGEPGPEAIRARNGGFGGDGGGSNYIHTKNQNLG